jgi:hypothetical protein
VTTFYYRMPDGALGKMTASYAGPAAAAARAMAEEAPLPPELEGAELLTAEEYGSAMAVKAAAAAEDAAATLEAELAANRRKYAPTALVVVAASAPQYMRDVAAYVCDGTDDHVQINQAIAEAVSTGVRAVRLSSGTFHVADSVRIPAVQGFTLEGKGWQTVIKNAPASNRYAVVFDGTGDTRIVLRDLTIDGSSRDQTSGGGCVYAPGAVQCWFDHIHFAGFWDTGLYLGPVSGGGFGHNNRVTNCLFDDSMSSGGEGTAIRLASSDENWISDCDVEYCGGATGQASAIYDQAGTNFVQGLNVVNGRPGIPAVRLKDCHRTRLVGCNFDGVPGDNVFVTGSGHSITSSTFSGVGAHATPGTVSAVHLEFAATRNVISGNVFETDPLDGAANSLVREDGDGGTGQNLITSNQFIQKGAPAFGLLTLGGTGSVVAANMGVPDVPAAP